MQPARHTASPVRRGCRAAHDPSRSWRECLVHEPLRLLDVGCINYPTARAMSLSDGVRLPPLIVTRPGRKTTLGELEATPSARQQRPFSQGLL